MIKQITKYLLKQYPVRLAAACAVISLICSVNVRAAFLVDSFGTRAAGKAGAAITSIDDASAADWNPAALVNITKPSAMFEYYSPFAGLPDVSLSYMMAAVAYPYEDVANLGISYSAFQGDDIYREHIVRFSGAQDLRKWLPELGDFFLAGGVSLKYLYRGYDWKAVDADDPIHNDPITGAGDGGGAVTLDLGFIAEPVTNMSLGLCVKNIIHADVGIQEVDAVPFQVAIGAGYKIFGWSGFEYIMPEVSLLFQNQTWGDSSDKIKLSAGAEAWFDYPYAGIRAGVNSDEAAIGGSYGIKAMENILVRVDYAALFPFSPLSDHYGHHRVSLSVNFLQ